MNMKKIFQLVAVIVLVVLLQSCSKTCHCTSRAQNLDGTIWEHETTYEAVGGESCEEAYSGTVQTFIDNEGNSYKSYECREE